MCVFDIIKVGRIVQNQYNERVLITSRGLKLLAKKKKMLVEFDFLVRNVAISLIILYKRKI